MTTNLKFGDLLAESKRSHAYWAGKAKLDFAGALHNLMRAQGVSRTDLATRVGCSPAYITKVLRGDTNFTIDTMAKLAHALESQVCVSAHRQHDDIRWVGVVEAWRADHQQPLVTSGWEREGAASATTWAKAANDDHGTITAA